MILANRCEPIRDERDGSAGAVPPRAAKLDPKALVRSRRRNADDVLRLVTLGRGQLRRRHLVSGARRERSTRAERADDIGGRRLDANRLGHVRHVRRTDRRRLDSDGATRGQQLDVALNRK